MLKLNPRLKTYPWIIMGISAGLFFLSSVIIVPALRSIVSNLPLGNNFYLFLSITLVSLIILNLLLFKKIAWFKLVAISLIIAAVQNMSAYIAFPFYMLFYVMGGNAMTPISNLIYVYVLSLVAVLIYSMAMYEKKRLSKLPFLTGLVSFPIAFLFTVLTSNNLDTSIYGFFLSIGTTVGLYIGLKEHVINLDKK